MERKELVIIGGGPAGLSAGIYASRAAMNSILLERDIPGGLVISTDSIENYPGFAEGIGGPELMMQMENQARRFGLEILSTDVEKIVPGGKEFIVKTNDDENHSRRGDHRHRRPAPAIGRERRSRICRPGCFLLCHL